MRYHVLCVDKSGKATLSACYHSAVAAECFRSFQQAVTAEGVTFVVQQTQICTCPTSYR